MGLHRPDESFGMVAIDELTCHFCDRKATALEAWVRQGHPGAVWVCEEHATKLSEAGHHLWTIRRTCQVVEDDVPCGAVADWLEFVATEDKVQPASLCGHHAAATPD